MSKVASSAQHTDPPTWRELVDEAAGLLDSSREARWIAEDLAGRDRGSGDDFGGVAPLRKTRTEFARRVARRRNGEPLQHVIGHWPFRTVDLLVDRRGLIPRPETEVVVEYALAELSSGPGGQLVVDLGTGSGAIACAIAQENPRARVVATDISQDAIELARENRARLGRDVARRIELRAGDWFDALPGEIFGKVDLVVSNPPYVREDEWARLDPVVRDFDPKIALVAGEDGTEAIAKVIAGAPRVLGTKGAVILEIAPSQANAACEFVRAAGARAVSVHRDLAGRERVLVARW